MGEKLYYEPEQREAEAEINRLLETADREAHELIQAQKENTEKLAKALLNRETLTKDEVLQLLTPSSVAIPASEPLACSESPCVVSYYPERPGLPSWHKQTTATS